MTPRQVALTYRIMLALLAGEDADYEMVADEVGECPDCWRAIAERLAEIAVVRTVRDIGHDAAIRLAEIGVADALDDHEADR